MAGKWWNDPLETIAHGAGGALGMALAYLGIVALGITLGMWGVGRIDSLDAFVTSIRAALQWGAVFGLFVAFIYACLSAHGVALFLALVGSTVAFFRCENARFAAAVVLATAVILDAGLIAKEPDFPAWRETPRFWMVALAPGACWIASRLTVRFASRTQSGTPPPRPNPRGDESELS